MVIGFSQRLHNRRSVACIFAAWAVAFLASTAKSVPLPPLPEINICGSVAGYSWSDEIVLPAKPGFSGSLGRQRTIPARFSVVLRKYTGIDRAGAARINNMMGFHPAAGSDTVMLLIDSADRRMLDRVGTLCIYGYRIRGDEGGTWTHYRRIVTHHRK